jgi:hypothetical protein
MTEPNGIALLSQIDLSRKGKWICPDFIWGKTPKATKSKTIHFIA